MKTFNAYTPEEIRRKVVRASVLTGLATGFGAAAVVGYGAYHVGLKMGQHCSETAMRHAENTAPRDAVRQQIIYSDTMRFCAR